MDNNEPIIRIRDLCKTYRVVRRREGRLAGLRGFLFPNRTTVEALKKIRLDIAAGDRVGLVGPNGAGKSTLVKILSGVLVPDSGTVMVNGLSPDRQRKLNAYQIGVVFGQRSQLLWDLPCVDSLKMMKYIYGIPEATFRIRLQMFVELLDLREYLGTPVRQLSLGQRMRVEVVSSLLHDPPICFFDEPTIGLDIKAKAIIRNFILEINRQRKTTILLTTHDMTDIERLCDRLVMIDRGQIVYDSTLEKLRERFGAETVLIVDFEQEYAGIAFPNVEVMKDEGRRKWLKFSRTEISAAEVIAAVASKFEVRDLSLREQDIDQVIGCLYASSTAGPE